MTKDEMKNRISLALKDPILQQGFECICKENAELKEKLEHRNCVDCSNHGSNIKLLKAKEIIKELHAIVVLGQVEFVGIDVPAFKRKAESFLKECEQ